MAQTGDLGERPPAQPYWFVVAWTEVRPRVIVIGGELIVSVALLFVFAVFFFLCRLLVVVGVPLSFVDKLELIDKWAIFAVFATFSAGFVFNAGLGVYGQVVGARKSVGRGTSATR
jgi:uncharacterized membrane protein YGL010W